jgi:hypothetical protein
MSSPRSLPFKPWISALSRITPLSSDKVIFFSYLRQLPGAGKQGGGYRGTIRSRRRRDVCGNETSTTKINLHSVLTSFGHVHF